MINTNPPSVTPTQLKISEQAYERRSILQLLNYIIETFERFAKEIAANSDDYIRENYSNRVIIVDEVNNLRINQRNSRFQYTNKFIVFTYGSELQNHSHDSHTYADRPIEAASLLNLLLAQDQQFNMDTFMETVLKDGSLIGSKTGIQR